MTRSAISDALSPIVDTLLPLTFVEECAFASAPKPPPLASLFEEALTEVYEPTRASWSARTDELSLIVAFVPKLTLAVVWFVATPTKPPAVDLDDEPVTGALSASSVKLPPAMIQPEWPPEPTEAELLLVVEVSARAVPTPTKPPVAFFEFALVLVCEFDLIVTSPPAVTRSASTLADHVLRHVRRRLVVADADEAAAGAVRVRRRDTVAGRRVEQAERHAAGAVEALLRRAAGAVGCVRRRAGEVDAELATSRSPRPGRR